MADQQPTPPADSISPDLKLEPGLRLRKARGADRDAVLAFCAATWDWGDYIADVWDRWLSGGDGRLLVAEADGEPVALSHIVLAHGYQGWCEGIRVRADYRRRGLGARLTQFGLAEARQMGAGITRLMTYQHNEAIHALLERQQWRHVSSNVVWRPSVDTPKRAGRPALLPAVHIAAVANRLPSWLGWKESGGLYIERWRAYAVRVAWLRERVDSGHVLVDDAEEPGAIAIIVAPPTDAPGTRMIGFVAGRDQAALRRLAEHVAPLANADTQVEIILPDNHDLSAAFTAMGFIPSDDGFWVHADPAPPTRRDERKEGA